jgi:hypothetical protein
MTNDALRKTRPLFQRSTAVPLAPGLLPTDLYLYFFPARKAWAIAAEVF